jgi:hypothetical protein
MAQIDRGNRWSVIAAGRSCEPERRLLGPVTLASRSPPTATRAGARAQRRPDSSPQGSPAPRRSRREKSVAVVRLRAHPTRLVAAPARSRHVWGRKQSIRTAAPDAFSSLQRYQRSLVLLTGKGELRDSNARPSARWEVNRNPAGWSLLDRLEAPDVAAALDRLRSDPSPLVRTLRYPSTLAATRSLRTWD